MESIGAEDICDGNNRQVGPMPLIIDLFSLSSISVPHFFTFRLILGLIWTIILRFQIQEIEIDVVSRHDSLLIFLLAVALIFKVRVEREQTHRWETKKNRWKLHRYPKITHLNSSNCCQSLRAREGIIAWLDNNLLESITTKSTKILSKNIPLESKRPRMVSGSLWTSNPRNDLIVFRISFRFLSFGPESKRSTGWLELQTISQNRAAQKKSKKAISWPWRSTIARHSLSIFFFALPSSPIQARFSLPARVLWWNLSILKTIMTNCFSLF